MSTPVPSAPTKAATPSAGDLLAALLAAPVTTDAAAGFGALVNQALGLAEKGKTPGKDGTKPEKKDIGVPPDPRTAGVIPGNIAIPLPVTQRPAGPDAQDPGVGVEGTGPRAARHERNGWLPALGFGAGGPEGHGTAPPSTPPTAVATPVAPITIGPTQTEPSLAAATTPTTVQLSTSPTPNPISTHVVDQISDKITSLVSRGDGTHRITLRLQPEQLGDVRVVMTVRDGTVHVRLAAGERDTRTALADGSAELHRLLESAGATDAKVVVRELGREFGRGLDSGLTRDFGGHDLNGWSFGSGQSSRQNPQENAHDHAGTRAQHQARDGHDTNPRHSAAVATGTRPSETVTSSHTGLDVTM